MSAVDTYEKIQAFKVSRTAIVDGVNYACVVAPYLYDESRIGLLKKLLFSFFFVTRITVSDSRGGGLLLYYSCRHKKRADYNYIPQYLRELLDTSCDYIESMERFSLAQFFHVLQVLPSAWRNTQGYRASRLKRLGCALLIAKYRLTAKKSFSLTLRHYSKLITFCDAQAPENLLAQMANAIGVETFTTQHGQYRILDASNIGPDAEAYANFVSDYMLCWGEATRHEFVRAGFDSDQFVVTGWIKAWGRIKTHQPTGVLGVMLNGENGRVSNASLLEAAKAIACSLNMQYLVRLHPLSQPKQYTAYLDERCIGIGHYDLPSYLQQVDFSVAHMTGATIEILHADELVYLLDDRRLAEVFRVDGLSFISSELMVSAILKDMKSPGSARQKVRRLSKWFNDDDSQSARICSALLDERV